MPKYKHHWPTLKLGYVEGIVDEEGNRSFMSLEDTAKKYGIAAAYLRRVSAKEGWLQERHILVTKVEQARIEKKSDKLSGEGAKFDIKCLKVAEVGISHIARHFQLASEAKTPLPSGELAQLSAAHKNFQQIGRLALGDSTEKVDAPRTQINNLVAVDYSGLSEDEISKLVNLGFKLKSLTDPGYDG